VTPAVAAARPATVISRRASLSAAIGAGPLRDVGVLVVFMMPGAPVVARRVLAPAVGLPVLGRVVAEIILVVSPEVAHSCQDDDHDQGDDSRQNDQHRLVHRTIHRGLGLRMALVAPGPAIGTGAPVSSSALDSFQINR
jgi:hypothetical protein